VPLYSVSAGMLGTQPQQVEKSLDEALELCRMWNAMLLLDEADVFLGSRTDEGLTRNELVSSQYPSPLVPSLFLRHPSFPQLINQPQQSSSPSWNTTRASSS